MRIDFSPAAEEDLEAIGDYIARDNLPPDTNARMCDRRPLLLC